MIDLSKLKQFFPFVNQLSQEDILGFLNQVKIFSVKQGEVFFKEGATKKHIFYINKGLVRSFYINEKGDEITNRLRYENQLIAPYEVIFFNNPSRFNFQALEDTTIFQVEFDNLQNIIQSNTKLETARRFFIQQILAESLKAIDEFILLTPEQRYLNFIKNHPDLLNRAPNKYIANILGITPVSLSRIRKRIASKKQ